MGIVGGRESGWDLFLLVFMDTLGDLYVSYEKG
jgi:hypothetical protein